MDPSIPSSSTSGVESEPVPDPPFKGYIESTFDALLIFEAARAGMIPRVTRRLIDSERGMVQSGAVFVFDEHESGIKRWTDGLSWSPSRILGNFLVYRETFEKDKVVKGATSPKYRSPSDTPVIGTGTENVPLPAVQASYNDSTKQDPPSSALGHGALPRPRSTSDGGGPIDRQRERQLVGSLTNNVKYRVGGLIKKTMSITVNGYVQHMISYYTMEDVIAGRLRTPSTIPELASLEISPDYLQRENFRFPPMIEIGYDGIARYRGEPEEPTSPQSAATGLSINTYPTSPNGPDMYDQYGQQMPLQPLRLNHSSPSSHRPRSITVPMSIPLASPSSAHAYPTAPSSAGSVYLGSHQQQQQHHHLAMSSNIPLGSTPIVRQGSNSSMNSASGALRPSSSSRRYDPYATSTSSPRMSQPNGSSSLHNRRQSQPVTQAPPATHDYYASSSAHASAYDVSKLPPMSPVTGTSGMNGHGDHNAHSSPYHYQPPATAPGAFASFHSTYSPSSPSSQQQHHTPQHHHAQPPSQQNHQAHMSSPEQQQQHQQHLSYGAPQYTQWQPSPVAPTSAGRYMPQTQAPRDYAFGHPPPLQLAANNSVPPGPGTGSSTSSSAHHHMAHGHQSDYGSSSPDHHGNGTSLHAPPIQPIHDGAGQGHWDHHGPHQQIHPSQHGHPHPEHHVPLAPIAAGWEGPAYASIPDGNEWRNQGTSVG